MLIKVNLTMFIVALLSVFGAFSAPFAGADGVTPGNLHTVTSHILRSARPTQDDLKQFATSGVQTIVDLEDDPTAIAQETQWVQGLSIDFISIPLHTFSPVSDDSVNQILGILTDPSRTGIILVHCMGGEDRTGLVIGLYRVLEEGWRPQDAYSEMIYFGFHPEYLDLLDYYYARTGWNGN